MRRGIVFPDRARRIATHIVENVWGELTDDYEQVQNGVFVAEDGTALVVPGAAQVSDPGVETLRRHDMLWELAVLMYADGSMNVVGPRHLYAPDEWAGYVSHMVACTRDVDVVFSTFEVAAIQTEQQRADVGVVSAVVADAIPTDTTPNPAVLDTLMEQCDAAVRKAA